MKTVFNKLYSAESIISVSIVKNNKILFTKSKSRMYADPSEFVDFVASTNRLIYNKYKLLSDFLMTYTEVELIVRGLSPSLFVLVLKRPGANVYHFQETLSEFAIRIESYLNKKKANKLYDNVSTRKMSLEAEAEKFKEFAQANGEFCENVSTSLSKTIGPICDILLEDVKNKIISRKIDLSREKYIQLIASEIDDSELSDMFINHFQSVS